MIALNQADTAYFNELATRYRNYTKPTDVQKLLVVFYDKADKTKEDYTKIKALLNAERQAEIHFKNQRAMEELVKKEKDKERKALEHKKIVAGAVLFKAIEAGAFFENHSIAKIFQDIAEKQGFCSEKDRVLFSDIFQALAPTPTSPVPQNPPQNSPTSASTSAVSGFGFRG